MQEVVIEFFSEARFLESGEEDHDFIEEGIDV